MMLIDNFMGINLLGVQTAAGWKTFNVISIFQTLQQFHVVCDIITLNLLCKNDRNLMKSVRRY